MHFLFYNGNKWYKYTVFVKVTVKLWERAAGKLEILKKKTRTSGRRYLELQVK